MDHPKRTNKALAAVFLAVVLVLLFVIAVFLFGQPNAAHVEITLPEPQQGNSRPTSDDYFEENSLLQVTPDNAAVALQSLKHPAFYHQAYKVTVGSSESVMYTDVDLWVNGNYVRAQIRYQNETKNVMTDGSSVYLWYDSETRPVHLTLGADISFEDILGLPAFNYLQTLAKANVWLEITCFI